MNTGTCKYAERCTFAHGQHELRQAPAFNSQALGAPQLVSGGGGGITHPSLLTPWTSAAAIACGSSSTHLCFCISPFVLLFVLSLISFTHSFVVCPLIHSCLSSLFLIHSCLSTHYFHLVIHSFVLHQFWPCVCVFSCATAARHCLLLFTHQHTCG